MIAQSIKKEIFIPTSPGVCTRARTFYASPEGLDLISLHDFQTESDLSDVMFVRHSSDNGRTWSAPSEQELRCPVDGGMLRRMYTCGISDPFTGRLLLFRNEAMLPNDDCLEALQRNYLVYEVSEDGGRSYVVSEAIICRGPDFDFEHPLPGVWLGRSSVMLGDLGCHPLILDTGEILLPCSVTPLEDKAEAGEFPKGATFQASAVLRGSWGRDKRLEWELSSLIKLPASASTRGAFEPTLAALSDGRLMCLLRGSNDVNPALPSYRWVSYSKDRGATWTAPVPWSDEDGRAPYSPSSCSQLFAHSNGRLFWIGNLTGENPRGNSPRYPLVICEVNRESGLLIRETIQVVDDKADDESRDLMLSSFFVREDRETHEIIIHLSRLFANGSYFPQSDRENWTADASVLRVVLE